MATGSAPPASAPTASAWSASGDKTARVWNTFWSSLVRPENLIEEVCQRKLRGNVRKITEADVRAAKVISPQRVGEDVCDGVATVPTREPADDRSNTLRGMGWRRLTQSHRLLIFVSLDNKCRGAHAATMRPFDVLRDSQNDSHIAVHGRTEAGHRETDCSRVIRLQ